MYRGRKPGKSHKDTLVDWNLVPPNYKGKAMTQNQAVSSRTEHYFPHIDIFKGIVILLVIVGHIVQNSLWGGGRDHQLYLWIYTFHMPAFFFCSGFLNRTDVKDYATVKSYVIKKTNRILIPYLTWGVIMYFYSQKQISLASFCHYILLKPGYGLWFLQTLFKYCILSVVAISLIDRMLKIGGVKSYGCPYFWQSVVSSV